MKTEELYAFENIHVLFTDINSALMSVNALYKISFKLSVDFFPVEIRLWVHRQPKSQYEMNTLIGTFHEATFVSLCKTIQENMHKFVDEADWKKIESK